MRQAKDRWEKAVRDLKSMADGSGNGKDVGICNVQLKCTRIEHEEHDI